MRSGIRRSDGWLAVELGVGLALGAGFCPTAAAAQSGAARVAATARVLPVAGLLLEVPDARPGEGDGRRAWQWTAGGAAGSTLPSRPAMAVTRRLVANRRIIEVAAIGV